MQLGLIGFPLTHSFSARYFANKFKVAELKNHSYVNFEISNPTTLSKIIDENPHLRGLNVTIPHKESIMDLLDEVDSTAAAIGAVNTIVVHPVTRRLTGYNTDIIGFERSLEPLLQPHHTKALILGTGGAAKAVEYVLKKMGKAWQYVSRSKQQSTLTYKEITPSVLADYTIIINTTPLGTFPAIESCPDLDYNNITGRHLCYDLVYNPSETTFLKHAKNNGATIKNGLEMLEQQAEAAWELWTKAAS